MGDAKVASIQYEERTDEQRMYSNWTKATKLFERSDWSACVMRVATSAEIAANLYIRQFLQGDYALPATVVNALLLGATGGGASRHLARAQKVAEANRIPQRSAQRCCSRGSI